MQTAASFRARSPVSGGGGRFDVAVREAKDPVYIGFPNKGNSCYQNAALQSLLGLRPFLTEVVALTSSASLRGDDESSCRTLRAVAKLMVLRQKALGSRILSHLNELRDVFGFIDPAFRDNRMQDANEFLLRLLDTIKDEVDERRDRLSPGASPKAADSLDSVPRRGLSSVQEGAA